MNKPYYKIEYRETGYKITLHGITNNREMNDFSFPLHSIDNISDFIENWMGKKYWNQFAEGVTIFSVPAKTYKQISRYPKHFTTQ